MTSRLILLGVSAQMDGVGVSMSDSQLQLHSKEVCQMTIEDVVLVATVREDIHDDSSKTEVPV